MRIHILGFMAFCFVSGSVFATQSPPPSDASLHELLQVTQAHKMLDSVMGQMDGMMRRSRQQAMAGRTMDANEQKIMDDEMDKTNSLIKSQISWDTLEPMYIDLYRKTFTQKEINDTLTFYKSPSGQSVLMKMPVLMQQTMQTVQARMATLMPQIQKIAQDTASSLKAYEANKKNSSASPSATIGGGK